MALLLTEVSAFLITESGAQHLLIEPVTVAAGFPARIYGVGIIWKIGDHWELETSQDPIKSMCPDRLEEIARRLGAIRVEYKDIDCG